MNSEIKEYLDAVRKRKPRMVGTNGVNVAVLMQLQDDDVPRLCEMIEALVRLPSGENDAPEAVTEKARNGCKARFGNHVPDGWFRKRPVAVRAVRWTGENEEEVRNFLGAAFFRLTGKEPNSEKKDFLDIATLEGTMTAPPGWWIIRGMKGEYYPCAPDIFAATYEPA